MSKIDSNKKISEIAIPGSHNAHAWKTDFDGPLAHDAWGTAVNNVLSGFVGAQKIAIQKSINTILSGLAECQNIDIEKQLYHCIRYLDLRVNWRSEKDEFWCAHAVYTSSLRQNLEEIKNFLAKNKSETVVVD